jgi:hypothetical protein
MLRRLGALLSAMLLLNVSAAEALRVCASQKDHQVAPVAAPVAAEHQHHQAPAQDTEKDCETPKSTECCSALSSCGATLVIDGAQDVASVIPGRDGAPSAAQRAPLARVFSPEPPPPKA